MGAFTSDARLRGELKSDMPGLARRAAHLLTIPYELRVLASLESNLLVNTQPGWRPSDALGRVCRDMVARLERGETVAEVDAVYTSRRTCVRVAS